MWTKKGCFAKDSSWVSVLTQRSCGSNSLVEGKHDRSLGRRLVMIWAVCVCANIHDFNMWEQGKQWDCMNFRNKNTSICAWTVHFKVYMFHWLQISSISPRWLLMYQIKFQINLNLDFKVSKLMFLLTWLLFWVSLVSWPIHSIEYLNQAEILCSAATFWGPFF